MNLSAYERACSKRTYGRYIEPFSGSACLFFRLNPERAIVNDINVDL
ncbi:MAG: hypothetical protein GY934_06850, partial [Gammaproteobacteria bacterium]|nr:hypothetical protein [Gammaproteobacteria bacterium]